VLISGGEWVVSYPERCTVTCHVEYVRTESEPWGADVEAEFEAWIARAAAQDPWLRENPPRVEWTIAVPPAEVHVDHPVVDTVLRAGAELGRSGRVAGLDSWHDGATFTRVGGTPCICYDPHGHGIHRADEHVEVDQLVAVAQALALSAMRFCGLT